MKTIVIKPCERDSEGNIIAEYRRIHTTEVASYLHTPQFIQDDPRKLQEIFQIGNYMHMVIQTTAVGGYHKGMELADRVLSEIKTPQVYERKKEREFLINKLETGELVSHAEEDFARYNMLGIEKTSTVFVEMGKYYLSISVKADLIDDNRDLFDIKSAGSLWFKNMLECYNRDNYLDTCLCNKKQWIWYTVLHWLDNGVTTGVKPFYYCIYTKHKKTQKQFIKCEIDLEWGMEVLKDDLTQYFIKMKHDGLI